MYCHVAGRCRDTHRVRFFWWKNPNPDNESIKSTVRVDSSNQIQIRIFEIHNLSVFFGKGFVKSIFDKRFSEQKLY